MSSELNRDAKIRLWKEDLEWLLNQPRSLERDHIQQVLEFQIREWELLRETTNED